MIKLIIFDLDGVLVTTKDIHYISLNKALSNLDSKYEISLSEHYEKYDGLPTIKKLKMLTEDKNLPIEFYEQINRDKQNYTFDTIRHVIKRDDRLIEILKMLKNDGFKIYVASNSIRETVKLLLYYSGLIEYIDHYISNEDVKNAKPSSEIYLKCIIDAGVNPDEVLIIEDSPRGIEAAQKSKANLLIVENPEGVTYEKIISQTMSNLKEVQKLKLSNFNILIPMAGEGSRFKTAGYTFPKPMIEVNGKPMIQLVVDNLGFQANYIYVVRKEHYDNYSLKNFLNLITPNCKIIIVDHLTEGAACTTLLAKEHINNDNPLIIANSDQFIEWNPIDFYYKMIETKADGGILTFKSTHPKWSYVKLNEHNNVYELAEKDVISDTATCLHYNTPIMLENGKTELIGILVNSKSETKVISFNEKLKKFESKKITGWVKKLVNEENWYSLSFEDNRCSKVEQRRIHITGDHEILTQNGYKKVETLTKNDKILTSYKNINLLHKEFIDGTLLGDGYYSKPNTNGNLGNLIIKQSKLQKEWFDLKYFIIKKFGGRIDIEEPSIKIILNRTTNSSGSYKFCSTANPIWTKDRERWYKDGTKQVPEDILITPLSLATWYMDDGSLGSSNERLVLCTDSFNAKSIDILRNKLLNFNIQSKIWNINNGKGSRIIIANNHNDLSAFNFFDLIAKYIIPDMQYKLPKHFRNEFNIKNWELGDAEQLYSNIIVNKIKYNDIKSKHPHLYCLEVEDNHNFIAGNMVVSNCGIYYYKKGSEYVKYAEQMIEKNIRVKNEFYVAPIYNEYILDNKKIKTYNVEKMLGLGTPEDLDYFIKNYKS